MTRGSLRAVGPLLVVGIVSVEVVVALGYYALATTLPQVTADLHAHQAFSLAAAAAVISSVFGLVVTGPWADRAGAGPPLLWGFAALIAGALLSGTAPGIAVFVAGRLLTGVGVGVVGVALYSVLSRHVAEEHRGFVFAQLNAAWLVPSLVGPLLAGALTERWGWRSVYLGLGVLILVGGGLLAMGVGTRPPLPERRRIQPIAWGWAVGLSVAVLALHLGGERAGPAGLLLAGAGAGLTWMALRRVLPAGTLRAAPGVPRLTALRGLLVGCAIATEVYVPWYLQQQRGLSLTLAGLVIATTAVGWAAGSFAHGAMLRRTSERTVLAVATLFVPIGPVVTLIAIVVAAPIGWIALGLGVMGLGMGAAVPTISTVSLAITDPAEHASTGAGLQLAESTGASTLLAATGLLLGFWPGALVPVYLVIVLVGLAGAALAAPPRRSHRPPGERPAQPG